MVYIPGARKKARKTYTKGREETNTHYESILAWGGVDLAPSTQATETVAKWKTFSSMKRTFPATIQKISTAIVNSLTFQSVDQVSTHRRENLVRVHFRRGTVYREGLFTPQRKFLHGFHQHTHQIHHTIFIHKQSV